MRRDTLECRVGCRLIEAHEVGGSHAHAVPWDHSVDLIADRERGELLPPAPLGPSPLVHPLCVAEPQG
jgi:hypothetical protein